MQSLRKRIWVAMVCFACLLAPIGWDRTTGISKSAGLERARGDKTMAGQKEEQPDFALVIGDGNYLDVFALSSPSTGPRDVQLALKWLNVKLPHLLDVENRPEIIEAVPQFSVGLAGNPNFVGPFFYVGHTKPLQGINCYVPLPAHNPTIHSTSILARSKPSPPLTVKSPF